MKFEFFYDKQPIKFLKKMETSLVKRVTDKIECALASNPVPSGAKTIVGEHGAFRIRVGDYRVLYRIDYQANKIVVFKIDKRSRVY